MNIEIKGSTILYKGEEIGTITGDTAITTKPIGPSVKADIKKASGNSGLKFVFGIDDKGLEGPPGNVGTPGVAGQNSEVAPSKPSFDPEPKQHPSLGRKDPAWLAWKNRQGR